MRKLSMTSGRDAKLRLHIDVGIQRRFEEISHVYTERQHTVDACTLAAASTLHETCLATFACTHAHISQSHTHTRTHTVSLKRLVQLTCTLNDLVLATCSILTTPDMHNTSMTQGQQLACACSVYDRRNASGSPAASPGAERALPQTAAGPVSL